MLNKELARARKQKYNKRKHAERYGEGAGPQQGRHGNHAKGERHPRFNGYKMRSSEGYVAIAVPEGHNLRQAHGYAYEHQLVMQEYLGRNLRHGEVVHHRNGIRNDNRIENLEVHTRSEHAHIHSSAPGARDSVGRFLAGGKRQPL